MNKKRMIVGLVLALFTLLLSACGGKETGSTEAPKSNETETAGVLGKIKTSGTINIGIEGAYPPFNFYNDKNELEGFDVDITNEIAKRMGVKPNYIATPWDSIIAGLLSKKYDIILSSMAITEERKKKVDFTDPYYHTGAQLFILESSAIASSTDIKGRKIGTAMGTTFEKKANELGAELVTYKNDMLSFQDMANGRVEGVITDRGVGARIIKEKSYPFKPIGDPLLKDAAGIALNKNEEALRVELNKHLEQMFNDGTYEQISKKWFDQDIR
ncbi:ABC transporter substrate-binding protein [Brevibacillus choshinensis]|uniref:ABC transporter substrate-binding protein n=1 Tax=Brevibacillus choshinensis TaxID=54911 RepID=UPI002E1BB42D|nr:ABC transporter substrate-binding protein [Brevibacillus choshinensis]